MVNDSSVPWLPSVGGGRSGVAQGWALALCALCVGCSGGTAAEDVAIQFAAKVGDAPLECAGSYESLGAEDSSLHSAGLRFYIHDLRLTNERGEDVRVELDQEDPWQVQSVALLDFEDGSSGCASGTPEMNDSVRGTVPAGAYQGLTFTLGVPFELNHADAAIAPSPLNISTMFWTWNAGYKFLRVDGVTSNLDGWRVHIGSTGCDGDMRGNVSSCASPNRIDVSLEDYTQEVGATDAGPTVVFDLASFVADAGLDSNAADTPPGCMSTPDDDDCDPFFANLGLSWNGAPAVPQSVFRVE